MMLLSGCVSPGMEDYSYTVGTDYMLVRTSGHQISVVPKDGNDGTKPEIKAKVVQIAWDERYVLAKRLGLKKLILIILIIHMKYLMKKLCSILYLTRLI